MKTAVITGGAGGLGQALAQALQARGWRTVLVDLNVGHLQQSADQIVLACDLTDPSQLNKAAEQIISQSPSIDLVIYCAGITHVGGFDESSADTHRRVFEINYFAAVEFARAFLHPLRQSRGTHLAISSVAGFSPLYHRTAYAGSKHALEGFFKSLRSEEAVHGVTTVIAAPSFIATNPGNEGRQQDGTMRPGSASDSMDQMTPEQSAEIILTGLDKGRAMILVGRVARLSWLISRLSPALFQRLMERNMRRSE